MTVVLAYRRLPSASPSRGVGRNHHLIDRTAAGGAGVDQGAPDETQAAMVEMIGIEFIDHPLAGGAGANEGIDLDVLAEVRRRFAAHLVSVVLSDDALARRWIIGVADA